MPSPEHTPLRDTSFQRVLFEPQPAFKDSESDVIEQKAEEFASAQQFIWRKMKVAKLAEQLRARIVMMPVNADDKISHESVMIIPKEEASPRDEFRSSIHELGFLIRLEPFSSLAKTNFAIAHELGHFVLHSGLGKKAVISGRGNPDVGAEKEASHFGRALLMPKNAVLDFAKKEIQATLPYMALYFGVPDTVAQARLNELNLSLPKAAARHSPQGSGV